MMNNNRFFSKNHQWQMIIGLLLLPLSLTSAQAATKTAAMANHSVTNQVVAHSVGGYRAEQTEISADRPKLAAKVTQKLSSSATGAARSTSAATGLSYHSFEIYRASSELLADDDHDGYFHRFSVTFDADVQAEHAHVYAELYLSRNGGPWQHLFTTDEYMIYGDSSQDSYQVVTELADGYPTGHYDVLIDLYQVGEPYVVASMSSDDSNELYALPLEDAQRDEPQPELYYVEHASHGGSLGAVALSLLVLLAYFRQRTV
jgi:hypothetical protein